MAFAALSILISASDDRLPVPHAAVVLSCLGLANASPLHLQRELISRRRQLLREHSSSNPVRVIFESIESLPKGSLLTLAQLHGLRVGERPNMEQLCSSIIHHVGSGLCISREELQSYLACSSVESQLLSSPSAITPGTGEDPATQLQVHMIRQIAPILQLRPLRRLLKLHNIPYKEYVNTKALRKRVKTFLNTGIIPGTSVPERDRAV
ncbi:hypothetical protein C8F04DRAFT_1258517 [Mycena alexandri]|uniref:Uncharacterized protein n=1 Tax=Mycena alexandri TaxID=1745969 RepID=A0AAD6SXY2_9AGAR|nr:hypothetical protein C8F04DRAFT_1258517 [Mycena alexandri]